jgi:hypothetical protein
VQAEAPANEYVPTGQLVHVELCEYWPIVQLEQLVAPGTEVNPDEHEVHVVEDVAPVAVEYVPMEHDAQFDAPTVDAYVPAAQTVHVTAPFDMTK